MIFINYVLNLNNHPIMKKAYLILEVISSTYMDVTPSITYYTFPTHA
jgi:hypothetical protein